MSVLPTVVPLNINVNSFKFLSLNTDHDKNSEDSSSDAAAVPSVRTQQFVVLSSRYRALCNNKVVRPQRILVISVCSYTTYSTDYVSFNSTKYFLHDSYGNEKLL